MDSKPSSSSFYPKTINHIAVSVPNLEKSMKWYTEILGFAVIKQPVKILVDDSLIGIAVKDIHGPKQMKMRMAWLSSANQVGLEIFEYVEAKAERSTVTLNTGNQVLFTFVLLIQILKGCAKKFLKVEEDNGAKFGKLSQTKELK